MREELFDELIESVRQGGSILRGKRDPSRTYEFIQPDVLAIRGRCVPDSCSETVAGKR